MSGTTSTVLALTGGIFFLALLLPIFFDVEFPSSTGLTFVEKAICTIIPNGGGNYTCIAPDDIVFYNGSGVTITANDTLRTVFFTVDNNGTITTCTNIGPGEGICSGPVFSALEFKTLVAGTDINITSDANSLTIDFVGAAGTGENTTATSLGGDADIFKTQIDDLLQFRGVTGGFPINVTERTGDALIELQECPNNEGYKFNATSGNWECQTLGAGGGVDFAILTAGGATLQSPTSQSAKRITVSGTNIDWLTLEYDPTGPLESAVWQFQVPTNFDSSSDIDITLRFTQQTGSSGGICWDGSWLGRETGETIDTSFGTVDTVCETSLNSAGDISEVTMSWTSAEHGLSASDSTYFKLTRATGDASDTHGSDARFIDALVQWSLT